MLEYCISNNYFEKLQLLSQEGRESTVYLAPTMYNVPICIKKYNSSFWIDCSNDEMLKKIFLLHQKLKNSKNISPIIAFYDTDEYKKGNKRLVALGIPFLQDYISIDKISDVSDKFICIRKLVSLLIELISLDIYPTDLNNSNIMVSSDLDIQLIDLDGNHCKVNPKNSSDCYKQIFDSIRYRILTDLMLNEEEYQASYNYSSLGERKRNILKQKGYSSDIISIILDDQDNLKLDTILEVLNEISPFFIIGDKSKH